MKPNSKQVRNAAHRPLLKPLVLAISCAFASRMVLALPSNGTVVAGQATISSQGNVLQVQQGSDSAIINWRSFSVAAGERVNFNQPGANSVILNRVTGSEASAIFGSVQGNGRVFLVNPNGILFGAGAQISVGSLVASTLSIRNEDFLSGNYQFRNEGSAGQIVNEGEIKTSQGGTIALIAPQVRNSGLLQADQGRVGMAAGDEVMVDVEGDGLMLFRMDAATAAPKLEQLGKIMAEGGQVSLQARARGAMADTVLNMDGVIRARGLSSKGGEVFIDGGSNGVTAIKGEIDAGSNTAEGGKIHATGEKLYIGDNAKLDVSGETGGGEMLLGGGFHGENTTINNAQKTYIASGAELKADAGNTGNGGEIVVWADDTTRYYGDISARGGAQSGNGGNVEVSGKINLDFQGGVDLGANKGKGGSLLLDPKNIILNDDQSSKSPKNNTGDINEAFNDHLTSNGNAIENYEIKISGVENYSNLTLQAKNDITVSNDITMAHKNASVTLIAGNDIKINGAISVGKEISDGTLGSGGINLTAGDSIYITKKLETLGTGSVFVEAGSSTPLTTAGANSGVAAKNLGGSVEMSGAGAITTGGNLTIRTGTEGSTGKIKLQDIEASGTTTTITAGSGGISQNRAILHFNGTLKASSTGDIVLDNLANVTNGVLDIQALNKQATIRSQTGITFGVVDVGGLTAEAYTYAGENKNGGITQTTNGKVEVTGDADFTARYSAVTLNKSGDNFFNSVRIDGSTERDQALSSNNTNGITLRGIAGKDVDITSAGNIRQSASLHVGGKMTLRATTNAAELDLTGDYRSNNNDSNYFTNGISLATSGSGKWASISVRNDRNAIDITGAGYTGLSNLNLIYTNAVISNLTGFLTPMASNGKLTLHGKSIDTPGTLLDFTDFTQKNITPTLKAEGKITLPGIKASSLSVTSGLGGIGEITQDLGTSLDVSAGTATLTAGNNNIVLNNAGNDFKSVSVVSGKAVTLFDSNDIAVDTGTAGNVSEKLTTSAQTITLGRIHTGGLDLKATGTGTGVNDGISQLAGKSITVTGTGTTNLEVATDKNIQLANTGNDFNTVIISQAGTVTLGDKDGIDLGASTVSSNLTITAGGPVTQTGALTVTNATSVTATGNDITLDKANQFGGAVSLTGNKVRLDAAHNEINVNGLILGASTVTDSLTITSADAITQTGALKVTNTTSVTATGKDITLDKANQFGGAVSLTGSKVNLNETSTDGLVLGASTVTDSMTVTSADAITQTGALKVTNATSVTATGKNITLDKANQFGDAVSLKGSNVSLNAAHNEISATGLILGASTATGSLTITSADAVTQTGALTVTNGTTTLNAGTANDITLTDTGNDFKTLSIGSGMNVTVIDKGALDFGQSTITGNLTVTSGGDVTQSDSNAVMKVGGTSSFTNSNTVTQDSGKISVLLDKAANQFAGTFTLQGNGQWLDAGLRNAIAPANLLNGIATTLPTLATGLRNLSVGYDNAAIELDASTVSAASQNIAGTLSLSAGTSATPLNIKVDMGSTSLPLKLNGKDVTVSSTSTNGIQFGESTVTGKLDVTAAGAVTQTGGLKVTKTTNVDAVGQDVTLDKANQFGDAISVKGREVTLNETSTDGLMLGASTVTGSLIVTSADAVTQTGALTVSNTTSVTVTGTGKDITLDNNANQFGGAVSLTGNKVSLNAAHNEMNAYGLILGASTVADSLIITSADAITQTGALTVSRTTSVTGKDITLDQANQFGGAVSLTGSKVSLNAAQNEMNANGLILGASTATDSLTITSADAITQTGALTVSKTTSVTGKDITLTKANQFGGAVSLTGEDVTLNETSTDGLVLGASTMTGDLTITAGGPVTQTEALTVTNTTSVTATGKDITLDKANQFGGAVSLTGSTVTLNESSTDGLVLGTSTVSGNLTITAGGPVTQTGALTVTNTNTTSVTATGKDITLDKANQFGGAVSLTGKDVALNETSADGLVLGASTVTGRLDVTVTGEKASITNNDNLTLGTATTLSAEGGQGTIVLSETIRGESGSLTLTASQEHGAILLGGDIKVGSLDARTGASLTIEGQLTVNDLAYLKASQNGSVTLEAESKIKNLQIDSEHKITASGKLQITGSTELNAQDGISLSHAENNFAGSIKVSNAGANNSTVEIKSIGALDFGVSDVTGTMTVTSGSNISQSGTIKADILNASAVGNITLADTKNEIGKLQGNGQTVTANTTGTLHIGDLGISSGGALSAGNISIDGALTLNAGTLTLTASDSQSASSTPLKSAEGSQQAMYKFSPLLEATAVISQGSKDGKIISGEGSAVQLLATGGGSIDLSSNKNTLNGTISAESGSTHNPFSTGPSNSVSVVRLWSDKIDIAAVPVATGQPAKAFSGIVGDVVWLKADSVRTADGAVIAAKLPYDLTSNKKSSAAALTFEVTRGNAPGSFGNPTGPDRIAVRLADNSLVAASFAAGASANSGFAIYLSGPEQVRPQWAGDAKVYYNGAIPKSATTISALNVVHSLAEEARRARFEEIVRTENVSVRLRKGVIAEVGPGKPATISNEPLNRPATCAPTATGLNCSQ